MKALSVRQPWAWAIIHGGKDIENRVWNTRFRGMIAVHAAGTRVTESIVPTWSRQPLPEELVYGAIIGVVEIIDAVKQHQSPWFEGPYGFVLTNPQALAEPLNCPGAQSLWDLPPDLERSLRDALGLGVA